MPPASRVMTFMPKTLRHREAAYVAFYGALPSSPGMSGSFTEKAWEWLRGAPFDGANPWMGLARIAFIFATLEEERDRAQKELAATNICWHCKDCLEPIKPRCETCPEECSGCETCEGV